MPVLHKYKDGNAYYALTSIKGQIVTFQVTSEGFVHLREAGVISGKPFNRSLLLDCYRMGYAFTGHSGFEGIPGQGVLDFSDDPEPETMFPSCSTCKSHEDLHFVELLGNKHSATILCGACRKNKLAGIDTSIPLPFVTRSVLNHLLAMKDIHGINKSVSAYQDLLNAEFSEKWKALAEAKKLKTIQGTLMDDTPSNRLV